METSNETIIENECENELYNALVKNINCVKIATKNVNAFISILFNIVNENASFASRDNFKTSVLQLASIMLKDHYDDYLDDSKIDGSHPYTLEKYIYKFNYKKMSRYYEEDASCLLKLHELVKMLPNLSS